MKKSMKLLSILCIICLVVGCVACFTSCKESKPVIGIIQFGTHGSLNNCYTGIIAGLKEDIDLDKYDVQYLNSNFSAETSLTQAQKLVNSQAKVIIAIATPSAIQAATAATGKGVPTVYCAVTDASVLNNFENITGTSDIPDFAAQLEIVTKFLNKDHDIKIGVLMSSEESSDPLQLTNLKEEAKKYTNITVVDKTVQDITTISTATEALIAEGIDCIVNLLDNTIVGKLDEILVKTNAANIPVFGSEIEQVKVGCLASASIDYITVGKLAGKQAAEILSGKKASDVARKTMENETYPYYNATVLATFGYELPTTINNLKAVTVD